MKATNQTQRDLTVPYDSLSQPGVLTRPEEFSKVDFAIGNITKWFIDGFLPQTGRDEPQLISEPFLTEGGANHFATLLTERRYVVAVRKIDEEGRLLTIADAGLAKWMNSE